MIRILALSLLLLSVALTGSAATKAPAAHKSTDTAKAPADPNNDTFSRDEIVAEMEGFFAGATAGLAEVVEKAFKDNGRPVGYIKGTEGSGAFVVGLRYGEGTLRLKSGKRKNVYWQGPSLGLDWGGNASKVFTLVYNLSDVGQIFQRFPGVDGSAYLVGGFGMNYQQSGDIVLAPIRTGVGLRLGASVGYIHYTREQSYNPF